MDIPLVEYQDTAKSLQLCRIDSCMRDPQAQLVEALKGDNLQLFCDILYDEQVSVNEPYPQEQSKTCLHIACELGREAFVRELLGQGADPNIHDKYLNCFSIHTVAENGNDIIMSLLLEAGADVNTRNSYGRTALHEVARRSGLKWLKGDQEEDPDRKAELTTKFAECMKLLLRQPSVVIDTEDIMGCTPLYLAAHKGSAESVRLLLQREANVNCEVDGETALDLIQTRMPEVLDGVSLTKNMETYSTTEATLFKALYSQNLDKFRTIFTQARENNNDINPNYENGQYTFLQYACDNGYHSIVSFLLKNGANPNLSCINYNYPPIVLAAYHGYYKVLEVFLNACNDVCEELDLTATDNRQDNILHKVLKRSSRAMRNVAERNYDICLKMLLYKPNSFLKSKLDFIINAQDIIGNSPLHYATHLGNEEAVTALLNCGANIGIKNKAGETPIIHILPQTLERFLDNCLETHGLLTEDNFEMTFKYSFLAPPEKNDNSLCESQSDSGLQQPQSEALPETEPLWHLSQSQGLRHLLNHPVISSFLWMKWQRIRCYFYANLLFYMAFVILLTSYVLLRVKAITEGHYSPPFVSSNVSEGSAIETANTDPRSETVTLLWYLITILLSFLIIRELFQMLVSLRRYIFSLENLLEVSMIITLCIILCGKVEGSTTQYLAAVAILLSWAELVMLIGRHPRLSMYITIFTTVSCNFFFFLLWYSVLIIAFALSFYILFCTSVEETPDFRTPESSLLRTFVMLTGELDYGSLPFHNFVSHVIFVLFLFLIVIVLVNLLNGLAVSDIQVIKREAEIVSYTSQVELISYIESMLLGDPFHFLSNWPPLKWIQCLPGCAFCKVLYKIPTIRNVINWTTGGEKILVFSNWLKDKQATFFPNRAEEDPSSLSVSSFSFLWRKQAELSLSEKIIESAKSVVLRKSASKETEDVKAQLNSLEHKLMFIAQQQNSILQFLAGAQVGNTAVASHGSGSVS